MKIPLFKYIDDAIETKHELRFEIETAQKAIDAFFTSAFSSKEYFVNYTSRVKADDSLKEKIIRYNLAHQVKADDLFSHISDLIGCRIECRFISDEEKIYEELFDFFRTERGDGYFRLNRDPRIELRLGDPQPQSQKNGVPSYRIDGRFLGDHVLSFELQIKSIVNVFWNEIDHKILYKNYNYVLTESFVHELMGSILGDLKVIDSQMEIMYNHLRSLDRPKSFRPQAQIKMMIGRLIQDFYLAPLREGGITFDFREPTDLITDFLFARVQYDTREQYATEFLRIMDEAFSGQRVVDLFGEKIVFDPPIRYHSKITTRIGQRLETVVNEDILWNLLLHILFDLNTHMAPRDLFRTFVDYLHFRVIHSLRRAFEEEGMSVASYTETVDRLTEQALQQMLTDPEPCDFTEEGLKELHQVFRDTVSNGKTPEQIEEVFAQTKYGTNNRTGEDKNADALSPRDSVDDEQQRGNLQGLLGSR